MPNRFLPPIVEENPAPYDPDKSRIFVKAFQVDELGKLHDLFHPNEKGYEIGQSVRKDNITMLSASTTKEENDQYLEYMYVGKKNVVQCHILSDDYHTSGEVRLNRYMILDIIEGGTHQ